MPTTLTRTVSFFAFHRLYRPEWSPERNRDAFGPLSEEPPHGHEYRCAVTVAGGPDRPPDLLIDLAEVEFCDSSGLSALLIADRKMKEHGGSVRLLNVHKKVSALLRISMLDRIFEIEESAGQHS